MSQDLLLGTLLAAAAVSVATAIGWIGAALAALIIERGRGMPPALRARLLAQARLLPLTATIVLVPAQIVAFARFEAGGDESPGPLLIGLAAIGLAIIGASSRAGWRTLHHTHRLGQLWRRSAVSLVLPGWAHRAWRIRRRYPVVAIVGVVRPQLFVAGQVADACTSAELAAIAAHERAHVRAADNLLRWLFAATPGAAVAGRLGQRLERAWMAAAEQAADADARRCTSALDLASALTRVASMAVGVPTEPVASSTLVGGSDLQSRVERLLAPLSVDRVSRLGWLPLVLVAVIALLLLSTPAAVALHETFELLVKRGG